MSKGSFLNGKIARAGRRDRTVGMIDGMQNAGTVPRVPACCSCEVDWRSSFVELCIAFSIAVKQTMCARQSNAS